MTKSEILKHLPPAERIYNETSAEDSNIDILNEMRSQCAEAFEKVLKEKEETIVLMAAALQFVQIKLHSRGETSKVVDEALEEYELLNNKQK